MEFDEPLLTDDPDDPPVPVSTWGSESDEDASDLSAARANLSSTDWTVETIVRQMRRGRIDLNPRFQRRAAWTPATTSRFIESAILAYPIPQLVLAEYQDRPGNFFVIDGKQRLLAIRQFYAAQVEDEGSGFAPAELTGLTILKDLKGFSIVNLEEERKDLFDGFENHTIRTVVIRNWETETFLFTLFLRLNTGSVPLSPQELRQALVPGAFVEFVDQACERTVQLQGVLGNRGPDRRMVDAELLVRFLGFRTGAVAYRGNLKQFLDDTCRFLNQNWSSQRAGIEQDVTAMEEAVSAAREIFGIDAACHKWSGTRWERSFNKAIFDVQVGALADPECREASLASRADIVERFKALCINDVQFANSISTTTKSLPATRERFQRWFAEVEAATGVRPQLPRAVFRDDEP